MTMSLIDAAMRNRWVWPRDEEQQFQESRPYRAGTCGFGSGLNVILLMLGVWKFSEGLLLKDEGITYVTDFSRDLHGEKR